MDPRSMRLDGAQTDAAEIGHFGIGVTEGDEPQHLLFLGVSSSVSCGRCHHREVDAQ